MMNVIYGAQCAANEPWRVFLSLPVTTTVPSTMGLAITFSDAAALYNSTSSLGAQYVSDKSHNLQLQLADS